MPSPPFLLATLPALHPVVTILLTFLLTGGATWFWTSRSERKAAKSKALETEQQRLREVAETARLAEADKQEWERYKGRLQEAEDKIKDFVGEKKLTEQFSDINDRLAKQGAHLVVLQNSHHEATGHHEGLKGDVRRAEANITQLNALSPRVSKTESDILLLLQQMQQLKEGQSDIKRGLEKVADESHKDRDAIINAMRDELRAKKPL